MQCDARRPRELSAHRGICIISGQVESKVFRVARGVAGAGVAKCHAATQDGGQAGLSELVRSADARLT